MKRLPVRKNWLSYHDRLKARPVTNIDLVVIHCTELPDLGAARDYGEHWAYPESRTGNSGHFYIDRDGSSECWVAPVRIAHHVRRYNQRSIGIELINNGRWPDWLHSQSQTMSEAYPDQQIQALLALLKTLLQQIPTLEWIAGHETLDQEQVPASDKPEVMVYRKRDPGPLFPWPEVLEACPLRRMLEPPD